MVRWASAPWLLAVAVLGLGGLAMAQDGLIVDPWRHPNATPFGERPSLRSPGVQKAARLATPGRKTGPSVVPLGPPLALRTNPGAVVPLGPAGHEDIVDPWASSSRSTAAERPARLAAAHRNWSWEVQEIVDPWRRGPLAVATDPAIVDPWAR
jgi:hypothetical protein